VWSADRELDGLRCAPQPLAFADFFYQTREHSIEYCRVGGPVQSGKARLRLLKF
jgi:hypothetical protein